LPNAPRNAARIRAERRFLDPEEKVRERQTCAGGSRIRTLGYHAKRDRPPSSNAQTALSPPRCGDSQVAVDLAAGGRGSNLGSPVRGRRRFSSVRRDITFPGRERDRGFDICSSSGESRSGNPPSRSFGLLHGWAGRREDRHNGEGEGLVAASAGVGRKRKALWGPGRVRFASQGAEDTRAVV